MLQVITLKEAKKILQEEILPVQETEKISLLSSKNRILAQDIIANENIPISARSMVDGYAVKAADTFGATESIPAMLSCTGEIPMGQMPTTPLGKDTCMKILTGGFLPNGADAAVMHEDTDILPDKTVCIRKPASPQSHVALAGDDLKKGECAFQKGTLLSSRVIGTLAAMGIATVLVYRKVRVGIFSTGDELKNFDVSIKDGEMRDVNRLVLSTELDEKSIDILDFGIVPDQKEKLAETLLQAQKHCDMIVFSGSTSAGNKDFGATALEELGQVLWHGLAVKPGKPTLAGKIENTFVLALPGHPAAAFLLWKILGKRALHLLQREIYKDKTTFLPLAEPISANDGRELVLPIQIKNQKAYPIHSKSGLIRPLYDADGYACIPRNCEGKHAEETIEITYFD